MGMTIVVGLTTFWAALGTWVAVFPGTLEGVFGIDYAFTDHWGVSRLRFEVFTLGTLAVLAAIAIAGYVQGRGARDAATRRAVFDHHIATAPPS
jgi:hypothetical protein